MICQHNYISKYYINTPPLSQIKIITYEKNFYSQANFDYFVNISSHHRKKMMLKFLFLEDTYHDQLISKYDCNILFHIFLHQIISYNLQL